jgi:hypothetical protein
MVDGIQDRISQEWHYALLGGLGSVPFTLGGFLWSGSTVSFLPLLFGATLAGYLATRETGTVRGVGLRTGLVGGVPALIVAYADVVGVALGMGWPAWFLPVGLALLAVVVLGLGSALAAVVGAIGARFGGMLHNDGTAGTPART